MKPSSSQIVALSGLLAVGASAQTLADYQLAVSSQSPANYFKLDGDLADSVDPEIVLESFGAGGFTFDVFRNSGTSYYYVNQTDFLRINGTTNLINGGGVSNTTSTASGTISFLFRTLDAAPNTGQRYLFSAGGTTEEHNAFSLFLENTNILNGDPNSLKLRFGNTTTTILPADEIVPNTWYFFAVSYSESNAPNKATWYVGRPGGTLASGMTSNSEESVAGDGQGVLTIGNNVTLGNSWRNPGNGHLDEFAIWRRELTHMEVNSQFATLPNRIPPPASGYQNVIAGQSPDYYFKLDGSRSNALAAEPVLSSTGPSTGFTFDYFGDFLTTNAASYTAVNDSLVVSNNLVSGGGTYNGEPGSGKGTLSFLFLSLSGTNVSGQRFLFSAGGATSATNGFAIYMENLTASADRGAIKVRFGNSSKAILPPQDIVPSDWYYCAVTYDESLPSQQVTWYLGQPGGPLTGGTFDYVQGFRAGQGNIFVIGNHTNFNAGWRNPGTGRIDEFAVWHRVLSPSEITNQFAQLTQSQTVTSPELTIERSGSNVLLSWPADTPEGFILETTNVLDATTINAANWPAAGTPVVVGDDYVVTNAISPGNSYYRLRKP
ncbi:MAG TPA: hypothetical protein PKA41_01495 [Verrucomicrobiota bacterium]|nr:hypothetical protein [Verrucomicrobiota bacterium]